MGVAFDQVACELFEGRATLDLLVDLLSRLYPRLALVCLDPGSSEHLEALKAKAAAINPLIEIETSLDAAGIVAVVGRTPLHEGDCVYVGSEGWRVKLSRSRPVGSADGRNPFGAGAAACFAAANIFRHVFRESLTRGEPDRDFELSLLDFSKSSPGANPVLEGVDLGESHLVGIGAVGHGAAWALSRAPVQGMLHLVDAETIDDTNPQRYVSTLWADRGSSKVEQVVGWFGSPGGLQVVPHPMTWGQYLQQRQDWHLERVAVALDSAEERIAVQAALPRWLVNAWTQALDLGVSRHEFTGEKACLACLYLPTGQRKSESELIAEAIGLPQLERDVIRGHLYQSLPLDRPFLKQIAAAKGMPVEPLLPFEGKPLREFYSKAVCGGIVLQHSGKTDASQGSAEVPMAFQSALAGVLVASEMVIHAGALRDEPIATTTKINLLRPLGSELNVPEAKREGCICQDKDYQAAYRTKYERETRV